MNKKKLLLIDDNVDMLLIGKRIFSRVGYDFYTARNGQEGLETAKFHKPDIILLDYILPDINGKQFIKMLAASPQYVSIRNTPVVMLTAKSDEMDNIEEYYRLGLRAFLNKPFGHRELVNIVDNIVRRSQLEKELPRNGSPVVIPETPPVVETIPQDEWLEDLELANATISSLCNQLYNNDLVNLTEQQKMDIHAIYNSSKRLTRLIQERKTRSGSMIGKKISA
ncbi:MAG TPA: response regulator [bacterium]|nr:response regulator [bacterium]HPN43616.1 response regulator [bacterium]